MAKIKGRFAPLTEELGSDERFIIGCSDFEKLLYLLIIYTTHMTHHQAPIDPLYYQRRYGLRSRKTHIKHTIDTLCIRFPKLRCSDGKLSLLNSATYESQILPNVSIEADKESNKEEKQKRFSPPSLEDVKNFVSENSLKVNPEVFHDHYKGNGWKIGKVSMKDWKATAKNWSRREFTGNQIKKVKGPVLLGAEMYGKI